MLQRIFDTVIEETVSLEEAEIPGGEEQQIHVRNVVSSVTLLDDGQYLCLDTIVSTLGNHRSFCSLFSKKR